MPNVRTGDLTRHPLHDLVKHGRTFFIPDYLDVAPTMAEALEARSVIIVPLLDDEGAIRVLINLASSEPESEDKEAIRILEGICGHLSSAIERVAIGEQVIRERQNLTSLIRDIGFMVFIVGNDGRVRYVNPAVTDATGWERSEIVGRPLIELHPPDLRGIASYNIGKMVGDPDFVCRLPIVKRDGSLLHIESRIIRGEWDGEDVLIGVSQDKSEMISTTDALRNANRNLSLCTSITRHDILNKVLVIEGYHSMLRDEVHDGDAATMVRGIGDAAKAIRRMIEFTREYEQLGRSEPMWVDVDKAVWGSMLSTPGHVTIEVDCQMEVMADELFSRALHNLIENSVIHGGPSLSRISIMCIVDDVGARIVYEDDGVGIPYDDKTAIFEKGYGRVHGLGLFLCREVLDVTGMTIIEDGVPGEGARFIVHLPEGGYRQPSK